MKLYLLVFLSAFSLLACGPSKDDNATTSKEREDRDRARQMYSRFVGFYRGTITPHTGTRRPEPIEMDLRVVEVRDGTNENGAPIFRLVLSGYFHPTAYDPGLYPIALRPIFGRYFEDTDELAIQNSDGSSNTGRGSVSVSATYRDGTLEGEAFFHISVPVNGHLIMRRVEN